MVMCFLQNCVDKSPLTWVLNPTNAESYAPIVTHFKSYVARVLYVSDSPEHATLFDGFYKDYSFLSRFSEISYLFYKKLDLDSTISKITWMITTRLL